MSETAHKTPPKYLELAGRSTLFCTAFAKGEEVRLQWLHLPLDAEQLRSWIKEGFRTCGCVSLAERIAEGRWLIEWAAAPGVDEKTILRARDEFILALALLYSKANCA